MAWNMAWNHAWNLLGIMLGIGHSHEKKRNNLPPWTDGTRAAAGTAGLPPAAAGARRRRTITESGHRTGRGAGTTAGAWDPDGVRAPASLLQQGLLCEQS